MSRPKTHEPSWIDRAKYRAQRGSIDDPLLVISTRLGSYHACVGPSGKNIALFRREEDRTFFLHARRDMLKLIEHIERLERERSKDK
jgi:hypothetical protein